MSLKLPEIIDITGSTRKVRTFIALDLSADTKKELSRIINVMRSAHASVKWVSPKTAHLTLKFLGEVPEDQLEFLSDTLQSSVSTVKPFNFTMDGLGAFPGWGFTKILWAGIGEGSEEVKKLASCVNDSLSSKGFKSAEQEFRPHLTFGRLKMPRNKHKLKALAEETVVNPAVSHISKVTLFKSVLTPEGAVHTPITIADLKG